MGCSQDKNLLVKFSAFKGPFEDGSCDRLEGLKVDKSRFSGPCAASVDGPMNY
jgi:hypothetical protein